MTTQERNKSAMGFLVRVLIAENNEALQVSLQRQLAEDCLEETLDFRFNGSVVPSYDFRVRDMYFKTREWNIEAKECRRFKRLCLLWLVC